jgi:hypothetical protein
MNVKESSVSFKNYKKTGNVKFFCIQCEVRKREGKNDFVD